MEATHETAPEFLRTLASRRGWSSRELSRMTDGNVSASAIRFYLRGERVPRPKYAKQVALLFGPDDGAKLLHLWGHDDLADGFAEEFNVVAGDQSERLIEVWSGNQLTYPGRTLDEAETNEVSEFIKYLQHKR